jgi:DNA modification methylase
MKRKENADRYNRSNTDFLVGCAWDIKIDLELFWKEIKRIRKNEHTPCLMFSTTKYGYELIKSNEKEFRYDLVWDKQRGVSFLTANKMPMRSHEMIYVFSKAGAKFNRIDIKGDFKGWNVKKKNIPSEISVQYSTKRKDSQGGDGTRCVLSVINFMGGNRKTTGHPTEKPLDLYKFLIERYSDAGDTVLDPTFGSCNSGLASIVLKRNYVGIEKDNNFYWKAVNKII